VTTTTTGPALRSPRSEFRSVALPSEHGGWGLTAEPALVGLIVAPSVAGACLAGAALTAFLIRTPLKFAAVDRRRHRSLARTRIAQRVATVELVALAALVVTAVLAADAPFWQPLVVAAPLIAVEGWFDIRSRGRRLAPELAGATAVASVVAMIVLAGGRNTAFAAAVWLVLAARTVTSIAWVRAQVARLHGHASSARATTADLADLAAIALAATAVIVDRRLIAGAVAVAVVLATQRTWGRTDPPRPVVLGMRQMALGFGVALVTAVGIVAGG
jgi:hypothetical protein